MLQDLHGRRFHYLRLSITDVCNFRCDYCLPDGYECTTEKQQFLTLPEIKTILSAFAGLGTSKVRITGGEPTLRKDLPDIIATAANTSGIEQVAITTNGYRLPQVVEDWKSAGLTSLNVSIDSLDPKVFSSITGQDKLKTILTGVENALAMNLKVKVNAVLLKSAYQLTPFLDWLKNSKVTLRFIELMQTGDNQLYFNKEHLSGEPLKDTLLEQGWTRVIRDKAAGPAQEFQHPEYAGRIGLIMPYSKDFCQTCNRLRISATGKLHLCLFAEQGLDLRPYMQEQDAAALQQQLQTLLQNKQATHWLNDGYTGATKHLAMLGG
ncbi:MAG: GTP 3',8-cyclase MoaA [Aestuariibacter sp.]